jgi:hypothetical protein
MKIDEKILKEISRYNSINKYINEQEDPNMLPPADPAMGGEVPPAPADPAMGGEVPPAPAPPAAEPIDVNNDPDVEEVDGDVEEVDVTDLVTKQKSFSEKQDEYFDTLFKQIETMESKLSEMDKIMDGLNSLEQKIEKYRVKTPEEKLELRTLDSGPFKQNLADFFNDKKVEMDKTGKEYVLTSDDVENFNPNEIGKTFDDDFE